MLVVLSFLGFKVYFYLCSPLEQVRVEGNLYYIRVYYPKDL